MSLWFKNLQVYRLEGVRADPVQWARMLVQQEFAPPGSSELARTGWIPPRAEGGLVYALNRQLLLALATERKVIPAGAVNLVLRERIAEVAGAQGFMPGKKAQKEMRERIVDEMLPRALTTRSVTRVWVDPVNGWLVVDTATPSRADDVVKYLLKCFAKFPIESWRVQRSPIGCMTEWLEQDEAPASFTVDPDTTLQAAGESRAQVQYKRGTPDAREVQHHIRAGKQCTQLAITWDSKISFVLTGQLVLKGIKPLDVLGDSERSNTEDQDDRFASDFMLMTGEFNKMLRDLQHALGGEAKS